MFSHLQLNLFGFRFSDSLAPLLALDSGEGASRAEEQREAGLWSVPGRGEGPWGDPVLALVPRGCQGPGGSLRLCVPGSRTWDGDGLLGAAASEDRKACSPSKNLLFASARASALQRGAAALQPCSRAAGPGQAPRVGVGLVRHPALSRLAWTYTHSPWPWLAFARTALTACFPAPEKPGERHCQNRIHVLPPLRLASG